MSKQKSKILILSRLLSFPAINQKDWSSDFNNNPIIGDLVSLNCAAPSKWYLSWIREIDENGRYLLESVDDESLCWWSNVGFSIYDRDKVKQRPSWRWNDKQHALNKRWMKVARRNDAYIVLPEQADFKGNDVTLNVRIRFGFNDFSKPKTFRNWKKLTMSQMDAYYKESEKEYKDLSSPA